MKQYDFYVEYTAQSPLSEYLVAELGTEKHFSRTPVDITEHIIAWASLGTVIFTIKIYI